MSRLLKIRDLSVSFHGEEVVHAVQDVSFDISEGEIVALVGETGCGKSVIAHAIMDLLPPEARIAGDIFFRKVNLRALGKRELSSIRGNSISMIFQNPSMALNPVYPVGHQIAEPLIIHNNMKENACLNTISSAVKRMGFSPPDKYMRMYPSQCSGGMNQRFVIATSTILEPALIIADEPTKGLDSNLIGEVEDELRRLVTEKQASLLLITHDLSVARNVSDRIAIMYAGEIVELAKTEDFFDRPLHPYSRGLIRSLPENGFVPIPGISPSLINPPAGCRFHSRCPDAGERCACMHPELSRSENHAVRCFLCR